MVGIYPKEFDKLLTIVNDSHIQFPEKLDDGNASVDLSCIIENFSVFQLLNLQVSGHTLFIEDTQDVLLPSNSEEVLQTFLKAVQQIALDVFNNQRLEYLTTSIINEGLLFLRRFYPKVFKAVSSFKRLKDSNCNTLSIGLDRNNLVILKYNPTAPALLAIEEAIIAIIKSDDISQLDLTLFKEYVSLFGAFELFHEFYHVFSRHVYDIQTAENLQLENIIADQYVNCRLLSIFNSNPVVKRLVRLLSLDMMRIYTGISDTIVVSQTINNQVIKLNKASMTKWNKYLNPLFIGGHTSMVNFPKLGAFASASHNSDQLILKVQNTTAMLKNYQEFSNNTKHFIKLFTNSFDNLDFVDNRQLSLEQNDLSGNSSQHNDLMSILSNPNNLSNEYHDDSINMNSSSTASSNNVNDESLDNLSQGIKSNAAADNEILSNNNKSSDSMSTVDSQSTRLDNLSNLPFCIACIDNQELLDSLDEIFKEACADEDNLYTSDSVNKYSISQVVIPSNEYSIKSFIEDNRPSNVKVSNEWRYKIDVFIETATSDDILHDSDMPSRRIEGQRGGLKTVSKLDLMVLSFDASISMDVDKYRAALMYVLDLLQRNDIYDQVAIVYWVIELLQLCFILYKLNILLNYHEILLTVYPAHLVIGEYSTLNALKS